MLVIIIIIIKLDQSAAREEAHQLPYSDQFTYFHHFLVIIAVCPFVAALK